MAKDLRSVGATVGVSKGDGCLQYCPPLLLATGLQGRMLDVSRAAPWRLVKGGGGVAGCICHRGVCRC